MSENRGSQSDPSMGGGKDDAALDAYNARLEKQLPQDRARIASINEANRQFIADTQRNLEGQVEGEDGGATQPTEADQTTPVEEPADLGVEGTFAEPDFPQESVDPNSRPESE